MTHLYSHESGRTLVMYCGAVSDMPERSAPYVVDRAKFRAYPDACACCRLFVAARGALAALSQPKTYPGDVELARSFLSDALDTRSVTEEPATDSE